MMRYAHLRRLLPLLGLVVAAVMALSAAQAGATVVCPKGVTPPSPYCQDVKPTAVTGKETNITGTSVTFNGIAGAGVSGGAPTQYFWQYGTTTAYGPQTAIQTLGSCPSGVTPPSPYCTTPKEAAVSINQGGLTPCTTYHDRLVATNSDGTTTGDDSSFTTGFANPIAKVKAPKKVKPNKKFKVKITLRFAATVKIFIKNKHGKIVRSKNLGVRGPGKISTKIKAPKKSGKYKLVVFAKMSCGKQTVKKKLTVKKHHKHHKK